MNGENNHIFHTSALAGMRPGVLPPKNGWALFGAQLWLLAAFVAMSLVAVAAKSLITGDEPPAVSAALAVAGVALFPIAWRNVGRLLDRAHGEPGSGALSSPGPRADEQRAGKQLRLALHR